MNLINLKTLANICYDEKTFDMIKNKYNLNDLKEVEKTGIVKLVQCLHELDNGVSYFDGFYVNYRIKQINPEFDLLKYVEEGILNIELKSSSEKKAIEKQQRRNYFYLKAITQNIDIITYVSNENKFYSYMIESDLTIEIDIKTVVSLMAKYKTLKNEHLDNTFVPSKYLISPFNDTDKFLESKYILTQHQQQIVQEIIKLKKSFIIEGKAGTGKSLVLYDAAKTLMKNDCNIAIIHCGYLNDGHIKLKDKNWNIYSISQGVEYLDYKNLDAILVDEAQRMYPYQLKDLINEAMKNETHIIFSLDPRQYFKENEGKYNNLEYMKEQIEDIYHYKLTDKIRSNKEIASFIKELFDNDKKNNENYKNIEIDIIGKNSDFIEYIRYLEDRDWTYLPYTRARYGKSTFSNYCLINEEKNSHRVIGQEFDKVVIILDQSFAIKDKSLKYVGERYHFEPIQMVFQNITRTRSKLKLVIVDNLELYTDMMRIVTKTYK
ncbi:DEAD/DEAH box helicase family protein [Macrococcoides caseolyticum]|uniref:DEAD/DEAH box helicase family protein n=2 Tax=Macrococcoides caseolyticum TaxID=69966 RepID=UPI000C324F77|nr:DEAD/DEAH box helicase family protein [Macrococcus caseolyticus]PKE18956.1 ATP-binding protein [Macrococcus caseolyticus]PKF40336.1 ATP-binding protein [Macrococcus caseolyticus]